VSTAGGYSDEFAYVASFEIRRHCSASRVCVLSQRGALRPVEASASEHGSSRALRSDCASASELGSSGALRSFEAPASQHGSGSALRPLEAPAS